MDLDRAATLAHYIEQHVSAARSTTGDMRRSHVFHARDAARKLVAALEEGPRLGLDVRLAEPARAGR